MLESLILGAATLFALAQDPTRTLSEHGLCLGAARFVNVAAAEAAEDNPDPGIIHIRDTARRLEGSYGALLMGPDGAEIDQWARRHLREKHAAGVPLRDLWNIVRACTPEED